MHWHVGGYWVICKIARLFHAITYYCSLHLYHSFGYFVTVLQTSSCQVIQANEFHGSRPDHSKIYQIIIRITQRNYFTLPASSGGVRNKWTKFFKEQNLSRRLFNKLKLSGRLNPLSWADRWADQVSLLKGWSDQQSADLLKWLIFLRTLIML